MSQKRDLEDGELPSDGKRTCSEENDWSSAAPLPISHPFGERFSAPELSHGQYHVLDEVEEGDDDDDSELDEDELLDMLEADLPDTFKGTRPVKSRDRDAEAIQKYPTHDKSVLVEIGRKPVEPLPEGWVMATHCSGMPVFLHRTTRVATVTRPYFLGPGSIRKHDIPLHSVPCLQYWRELEKEAAGSGCPASGANSGENSSAGDGDSAVTGSAEGAQTRSCGVENTAASGCPASVNGEVSEMNREAAAGIVEDAIGNGETESASVSSGASAGVCAAAVVSADCEDVQMSSVEDAAGVRQAVDPVVQGYGSRRSAAVTESAAVPQETAQGDTMQEGDANVVQNGTSSSDSAGDSKTAANTDDTGDSKTTASSDSAGDSKTAATTDDTGDSKTNGEANVEGKDPSITGAEFHEYCQRRFKFRTIELVKFDSWKERRNYGRLVRAQRPQMSDKTKLLCFPMKPSEVAAGGRAREWVLNPTGKTWVCIFHEYLQRVLREQPVYTYAELENAATPYSATASVNGIQYGTGIGSSKKQAKSEAAKVSLQVLIPAQMTRILDGESAKITSADCAMDLSFFDSIRLEDHRVADLCKKAAEPSPFTILLMCLQRNFGLSGSEVSCRLITTKHQLNEFEMTVGKHKATATCKNKKDGKQLASQSLLQQLHPQLTSWGSLLRMYGNNSSNSLKAKRQEEREITVLQRKGTANAPNFAILDKLKSEMMKLRASKRHTQPIGMLQLCEETESATNSAVTLDMVDL